LFSSFSFAKIVKEGRKLKGYIVQVKGENINWARAATSIAREKTRREEVRILKSGGSVELFDFNGAREVSHKLPSSLHALKLKEPKPTGKCMYGILPMEFTKVGKIHVFSIDLLK